jgi:NADH-quinone oxidoreductase subunit N
MDLNTVESFAYIVPELVLICAILVIFIGDLFVTQKERLGEVALVAVAFSLLSLAWWVAPREDAWLFSRMTVHDQFGVFFKVVFALATLATVWMSISSKEVQRTYQGEYYGLLLSSTLGLFFMATSTNLLMAYLSLEFVSLTSYVLTGYLRHNRRSGEASLKYLIYGGVASGTMIYGMSWIFGLAGGMDYATINHALNSGDPSRLALFIALTFTLTGFGFKIAAAPFHMWAPDVYTGAPIPVTAFLSVGSKAGGFAILMRFFYPALSSVVGDGQWELIAGVDWPQLVLVLSMVTMTLGNLAALQQNNLKRLLAYSSIAHAGYMLMGFVLLHDDGLRAMLFYLATYYVMNMGAFLIVMIVSNETGREDIDGYRGLAWRGGALPAVAMAIFLFSLAGIPPFAGFVGKFYLFAAVIEQQLYFLALVGILNSVVSLYYYARIVRTMFLDMPEGGETAVNVDWANGALLVPLAVLTVGLGLYWAPVIDFADRSISFFMG